MNFSIFPPEINSLRMFTGAGSAPMLQAAAAWEGCLPSRLWPSP
ncbi:PPE domain-containing protein, partial [Mycobacterium marinum]